MEEPKPSQTEIPDPNSIIPPNQTPAPPPLPPPSTTNKRPLDQNILNSPYYKMRLIVKDLRPHFIQVLKTADFQKCDSARTIQEQLKILMSLSKEMIAEPTAVSSLDNSKNDKPLKDIPNGPKPKEDYNNQDVKPDGAFAKPTTDKAHPTGNTNEEDNRNHVGFFVGGSAFGWNFTSHFGNSEPVYYGITKEAFKAANVVVRRREAAPPQPQPS